MTPPERLTVYVCPRPKCRAVTIIPAEELPEGWAGSICYGVGKWHKPVMKVEYVPAFSQAEGR